MSAESDLLKGIIKLRKDGWRQHALGSRLLGTGPACMVGCLADDTEDTEAVKAVADLLVEECSQCNSLNGSTYYQSNRYGIVVCHNDNHLKPGEQDLAVNILKKALARV